MEAISDNKQHMSLGDRMKSYEKTESVMPYQAFVIRADGNSFSRYTKGLEKPFDDRFQRAMIKTANGVLNHFNARTVFVRSDEITLIFAPMCTRAEYDELVLKGDVQLPTHIYSGRHNKLETLVASKCSVLFNQHMLDEITEHHEKTKFYKESVISKVQNCNAIFDARMIPIPLDSEIEIVNNIIWRSCYDCNRNTVSTYDRHVLSHKKCHKKNSTEMIDMMIEKGFDWNSVPLSYVYGVFCKKVLKTFKTEDGQEYIRGKDYNFCTILMDQDRSKTLELFLSKYYEDSINTQAYELSS